MSTTNWLVTIVRFICYSYSDCSLGESSISIERFRELCQEIQSNSSINLPPPVPEKEKHYLTVDYPLTLSSRQRLYKFGRFVGRKGEHIRSLEKKFNVNINIFNDKSSKNFRQMVNKSSVKDSLKNRNNLCLLITINDKNGDVNHIKQSIENAWKKSM